MFNMKMAFAAAALAATTMAGTFSAGAAPRDRHDIRVEHRLDRREARIDHRIDRIDHRMDRRHDMRMHRYVERARLDRMLWARHYRVSGAPYFWHGRYMVRGYNPFGQVVLIQVNPWTGAFIGEFRL